MRHSSSTDKGYLRTRIIVGLYFPANIVLLDISRLSKGNILHSSRIGTKIVSGQWTRYRAIVENPGKNAWKSPIPTWTIHTKRSRQNIGSQNEDQKSPFSAKPLFHEGFLFVFLPVFFDILVFFVFLAIIGTLKAFSSEFENYVHLPRNRESYQHRRSRLALSHAQKSGGELQVLLSISQWKDALCCGFPYQESCLLFLLP